MGRYAETTTVSVDRSQAEINKLLDRYGADQTMMGRSGRESVVAFRLAGRHIRLSLLMPDPTDAEFTRTPTNHVRAPSQAKQAWEQACRARWRALALVIKAKLEAVECGISTIDDEFLSHILLGDGSSVGDNLIPQITEHYETGRIPAGLPGMPLLISGPKEYIDA